MHVSSPLSRLSLHVGAAHLPMKHLLLRQSSSVKLISGDVCFARCQLGQHCEDDSDCYGQSFCKNNICQAEASSNDKTAGDDTKSGNEEFSAQTLINSATSGKLNALGVESLLVVAPPPPPPPTCSERNIAHSHSCLRDLRSESRPSHNK